MSECFLAHIKEHHRGHTKSQFSCIHCTRTFPRIHGLFNHFKTQHENISIPSEAGLSTAVKEHTISKNQDDFPNSACTSKGRGQADVPEGQGYQVPEQEKREHEQSRDDSHIMLKRPKTLQHADNIEFKDEGMISTAVLSTSHQSHIKPLFDYNRFSRGMSQNIADFATSLYGNTQLPRSLAQTIISQVHRFTTGMLDKIQENSQCQTNYDLQTITRTVNCSFQEFSSEYRTLQHFQKSGTFIPSTSVTLTLEMGPKRDDKEVDLADRTVKIEVISISAVLKTFLELPNVFQVIMDHIRECDNSELFISCLQAPLWKNIASNYIGKIVLPLIVELRNIFNEMQLSNYRI